MSYFTDDEKRRLQAEWPNKADALGYPNVSQTQLSIARWAMGIAIGGKHFVYFPEHDELWRDDVLKLVHSWRKADALANELPAQVQGELL
jgi:hypothetical protein